MRHNPPLATLRDTAGFAMPMTLIVTLIVGAVSALLAGLVIRSDAQTGDANRWEAAMHTAEAGGDLLLDQLNDDWSYTSVADADPTSVTLPAGGFESDDAERDWALERFDELVESNSDLVVRSTDGTGLAFRPEHDDGEPADHIYAVGRSDHHDDERIVKMGVSRASLEPDHAILAGCSEGQELSIQGTGGGDDIIDLTDDENSDVHANCDLDLSGGNLSIQGDITAVGAIDGDADGGDQTEGSDPIPVPDISARGYYDRSADYEDNWFDLCPDGTIREPDAGMTPCEGSIITTVSNNDTDRGWRWSQNQDEWSLEDTGDSYTEGVYYVYQASAEIDTEADSSAVGSVLVEADEDERDDTGHIEMVGNSGLLGFMSDIVMIADGNIEFSGTSGSGSEVPPGAQGCSDIDSEDSEGTSGLVAANGFVDVDGNVSVCGSIMSAGDDDFYGKGPHNGGAGSISGNARLFYDPDLDASLTGNVQIVDWNELQ